MKRYKYIAQNFRAMKNCSKNKDYEWYYEHLNKIKNILKDINIVFDTNISKINYLVFSSEKHIYDNNKCDMRYIPYKIILTPSFASNYEIKIIGQFSLWKLENKKIKNNICNEMNIFFSEEIEEK